MADYQEARVNLANTQLNNLKSAAKIKAKTILRTNKKNYPDKEQITEISNAFANKMSTDIKRSKARISKIIESGGCFGSWLANLVKKAITNAAIPFATDNLPGLVTNLASYAINKFERTTSGKGAVRAMKGFTLFISNEDMNGIIKIIKSLEDSNLLIDGITETVKHEIKKTRRWISSYIVSRFISATSDFFGSKKSNWKRS